MSSVAIKDEKKIYKISQKLLVISQKIYDIKIVHKIVVIVNKSNLLKNV